MNNKIIIRSINLDNLNDVNEYFTRLSGVDPCDSDVKYEGAVEEARVYIVNNCKIKIIYKRARIIARNHESITLDSGDILTGVMPTKVLEHADELYLFVAFLKGFNELEHDDVMIEYFTDTWGSAYTECIQAHFAKEISVNLANEGKIRTHIWCPGQHSFELKNQKTLFNILKPEKEGCSLTEQFMMVPIKACSGIIGIVPDGITEMPKPCDYCRFKPTCPGSNKGCSVL